MFSTKLRALLNCSSTYVFLEFTPTRLYSKEFYPLIKFFEANIVTQSDSINFMENFRIVYYIFKIRYHFLSFLTRYLFREDVFQTITESDNISIPVIGTIFYCKVTKLKSLTYFSYKKSILLQKQVLTYRR